MNPTFNLLVIVLIGIIAYWHYLQGLFSATLSAIVVVLAACMAVAWHEPLVALVSRGRFSDQADAIVLVALFVLIYLILRVLFDKLVPGNVRYPVLVDRIGAPIMGLVAGVYTLGVLALAAQMLPFGPSIGGYCRFPMTEASSDVKTGSGRRDNYSYLQLDAEKFTQNRAEGLWVPVDDILVGTVSYLGSHQPTGSLAACQPIGAIHPDYLQELFGQRLGVQDASRHTAFQDHVRLAGVFMADSFVQVDAEASTDNNYPVGIRAAKPQALDRVYTPAKGAQDTAGGRLLVFRVVFHRDASDNNKLVSFSPAAIRLAASRVGPDGKAYYQSFFPIGTLENGNTLYRSALDDYLFVPGDKAADVVFDVPQDLVVKDEAAGSALTMAPGTLLEVKRLARFGLTGERIRPVAPARDVEVQVLRKQGAGSIVAGGGQKTSGGAAAAAATAGPFGFEKVEFGAKLPTAIDVGTPNTNGAIQLPSGGTGSLKARKFETVDIEPNQSIERMKMGNNTVDELYVPEGKQLVQVFGRPQGEDNWAWSAKLSGYDLTANDGQRYKPAGAWAKIKSPEGQDQFAARYNAEATASGLPANQGRPTDIALLFVVPAGTQLQSLEYGGKVLQPLTQKAP